MLNVNHDVYMMYVLGLSYFCNSYLTFFLVCFSELLSGVEAGSDDGSGGNVRRGKEHLCESAGGILPASAGTHSVRWTTTAELPAQILAQQGDYSEITNTLLLYVVIFYTTSVHTTNESSYKLKNHIQPSNAMQRAYTINNLSQIAMVGQEPVLFSGTVQDNIAYGLPGCSMDKIKEAASKANAHAFICKLESGYDTGK